jgi:hypothetical protein
MCTVLLVAAVFWSCVTVTSSETAPIDPKVSPQIKPGVSSLSEVLTLLGPPHYVIDGSRRLLDEESVWTLLRTMKSPSSIPTRELTAPEGTVILIYSHLTFYQDSTPVHFRSHDRKKHELFIYVSKADKKVIDVAGGQ